jgi:UDP-3-O-[3-hydroxymyristoyl] glucosamine N-acyltransferase
VLRAPLTESEIRRVLALPEGGDRTVDGVAPLHVAAERCLYFVNSEVTAAIRESLGVRPGCIVIAPTGSADRFAGTDAVVIEQPDPRAAIARVLGFIREEKRVTPLVAARAIASTASISPMAVIEGDVEIGDGCVIEPFCVIGPDVRIGSGTVIHSGTRVFPRVQIGADCVICPNVVIGHQGYGFVRGPGGNKIQIPHLGGVTIGSNVHVGASTTIQAGTILPTLLEDYVKLGDLALLGHNVRLERNASVVGGAMLGGRAVVGREAWVGMNVTIRDGRRVGEYALVGMDSSIQNDLEDLAVARAPQPEVRARTEEPDGSIGFARRPR